MLPHRRLLSFAEDATSDQVLTDLKRSAVVCDRGDTQDSALLAGQKGMDQAAQDAANQKLRVQTKAERSEKRGERCVACAGCTRSLRSNFGTMQNTCT